MDPEAPLDRPLSTNRPLFIDENPGSGHRTRPARIAALILGLLLAILAAGILTLSGPRSSRPAAGSGVTASAAVRASEPSNAALAPPDDPDAPLPDPVD